MAVDKACRSCGKLFRPFNTIQSVCYDCARQKVKVKKTKRKPLKKIGKVGRQWYATRQEWIQKNIPDKGYWECHYCGKELTLDTLTLDHRLSRSRHPELRFDLDNLVPSCWEDNSAKGSLSEEEYFLTINS